MSNPYNNEIIFNGHTLMSLKEDTVTPNKVLAGETFHDRSGAPQTGTLITHNVYDGLDSTSADDALSANMGKLLNDKITTFGNGWPSVSSRYSGQISNNSIKYIKRTDGLCMVFGQFDISSDISSGARTPIFEGLPKSSFTHPSGTVWVFAINSATNKSYRVAFDPQNGTLDEFYTAIPSGNYQLNAFTYLT